MKWILVALMAFGSFCLAQDDAIIDKGETLKSLDINYTALQKSSIGDILNKPLPLKETAFIINSKYETYSQVRDKLKEANVPEDLIFVTFAESKLKPIKTGAYAGIWQLNASEAKIGGLKTGARNKDERYNYLLATDAAIINFNRLYKMFGRWDLAILAYNCGEGRLQRAIAKAGSDNLDKLFDPQKKLLPNTGKTTLQRILSYQAAANELELAKVKIETNETE